MRGANGEPLEERAVHLLAAIRDTLYGLLAISTRHYPCGLLGEEALLKQFLQESRIEVMEHRHVAKLIAVVVTPIVKHFPVQTRMSVLFPILSWLICKCRNLGCSSLTNVQSTASSLVI